MTMIYVKFIRNLTTGECVTFRTVHEDYVPNGWELLFEIERFQFGSEPEPNKEAKKKKSFWEKLFGG